MGRTTLTLDDETKKKIYKVGAKLTVINGKNRSAEDIILYLVEYFERHNK